MIAALVLAAATPTIGREEAVAAWQRCVERNVDRYAVLNEPAETIAVAGQAACTEERKVARRIPDGARPDLVSTYERIFDTIERQNREAMVKRVLDTRLSQRRSS